MFGGGGTEGAKWGSAYPVKGMGDLETEEIIDADKSCGLGIAESLDRGFSGSRMWVSRCDPI